MMARMTFMLGEDYALRLSEYKTHSEEIAKRALHEAANIVADKIRENLEAMPEENFRHLSEGEQFSGLPVLQKEDLLGSFGVTPIELSKDGYWNVKIGFDGYGRFQTKAYPQGIPNQLLARAVESGSSVRKKHSFVRPAVLATDKAVKEAMQRIIDEETEKIMKG